jgi:hypothetical protein
LALRSKEAKDDDRLTKAFRETEKGRREVASACDAGALAILAGAAGGVGEGGAVERELRRFDQYCTHDGRRFRDQRAGIVEVAGRVEPGMEIEDGALEFVQAYLDGLLHAMFRRTSTLSAARAAVETCVPGELAKHAESEGTKAVTDTGSAFAVGASVSITGGGWSGEVAMVVEDQGREVKVLRGGSCYTVPASLCEGEGRNGRNGGLSLAAEVTAQNCPALMEDAALYVTAVLERLAAEILAQAGSACRAAGSGAISEGHVKAGIRSDGELLSLSAAVLPSLSLQTAAAAVAAREPASTSASVAASVSAPDRECKMLLVGDSGVGKTSLIKRLFTGESAPAADWAQECAREEYEATMGPWWITCNSVGLYHGRGIVIQHIPAVILRTECAERRLNDATARGQAGCASRSGTSLGTTGAPGTAMGAASHGPHCHCD